MTYDVFISYSSKDKAIADAVCTALEAAKIKCWIAPRDILPDDQWAGSITKAIASSRTMVLIFSENSNNSDNVLNELQFAKNTDIIIFPFKIGDILPKGEMEYYLNRTHWLDAMNPPTEKQMQVLVETVNRFLKTEIAEGTNKYGDYSIKSKETGNSSSTPNIDLTARIEPVVLASHMEPEPSTSDVVFTLPEPSTLDVGFIFISYKREDLSRIVSFMHRIVSWGHPIWYDRGIPGGAEWDALIEEKVLHCKVLLVFLSEASVESKWVRREIKFADSENRPILGIRLDKNVKLKYGLKITMNQYQMIDASNVDFSDELRKAIEYVRLI